MSADRPDGSTWARRHQSRRSNVQQVGLPETIASALFLLALITVAVWQFGGVAAGGAQIQVLNPNLALFWRVSILAVLVLDIVLLFLVWRSGRWTPALAVVNLVANGLGTVGIVVPLMQGDLLVDNMPQQLAGLFDGQVDWSVPTEPIAAIVIVLAMWDSLHAVRSAVEHGRQVDFPTQIGAPMLYSSTATPGRFSALGQDAAADLQRLTHNIDRGAVRPEHLVLAGDDNGVDVGRAGLFTHPDGTTVVYALRFDPARRDLEELYGVLFDGITAAARATGVASVEVSVVDIQDPAPEAKRAALSSRGWTVDTHLLQLEASTSGIFLPGPGPGADPGNLPGTDIGAGGIVEIDPSDPEVIRVMAAAMANSLDEYDGKQVAALGPEEAARAYRDMMADGPLHIPWLAHRGTDGINGIAAIQAYPTDWSLGYLGVLPATRRAGVGTLLATAMLAATARAGVPLATAHVVPANVRIRGTLEKAGFRITSQRTDFVLQLDGDIAAQDGSSEAGR